MRVVVQVCKFTGNKFSILSLLLPELNLHNLFKSSQRKKESKRHISVTVPRRYKNNLC